MNQRRRDSGELVGPELEALRVQRPDHSLAEFSKFPVDLTKTRLQIQDQKNDANFKEIKY